MEWQKKGYIIKLINKWYLFSDVEVSEETIFRISNNLLRPSYVSLESALSYYNIIPEAVYTHQSVSTRKTTRYSTPIGEFQYRTIPQSCYFGYTILRNEGFPILIAEFEKALLDYFYLNANLNTKEDLESVRFNTVEVQGKLNWEKFAQYAEIFNSPVLKKRINIFRKFILNAHPK